MTDHRLEFTASENPWAPTAVTAEINERTNSDLQLVGLSEQTGGTSSAAYVRWPDGREAVLTRTKMPLEQMRQTADILSLIRSYGLPVPRHDLVIELADDYVAIVQERLPGHHAYRVNASVVDAMVAMNERFANLLVDRPDVAPPPAFSPGTGNHRWHGTLGRYSDRSRRLLRRIRELGPDGPFEMTGDDVVHTDYSLGNVLWDEHRQISGIVDWNFGVARGDRRFALLGMRFHLATEGDQYEGQHLAIDRLDRILATTIDPTLLRIYWTHLMAHRVHWSIHNGVLPERIEHDLSLAESYLP